MVTAEDVQNSLYFIHMNDPEEDARFVSTPSYNQSYEQQQSAPTEHSHPPTIQRKAVPNASTATGASIPPQRKPVPGTLSPWNDYSNRQNVAAANQSHLNSNYLGLDYTPRRSLDSSQYQMENERPPISAPRHSEQARSVGTSLTLIRRDPSSGAQWNIARVEDPPVLDASSAFHDGPNKRPIGAPLYIDITNPGYSKFLHSEQNLGLQDGQGKLRENPNVFHRRLWMEGAELPSGGFGHRKINSRDSSASPRHSLEGLRRASADTRAPTTLHLSSEHHSRNINPQSGRQTAFRGYVFMSPWNGRCEFSTGAGGASLKCQHVVPGLQGAAPVALPVSELRFNLPATTKASTPRSEEPSKKSSFFHRPRHNRHSSNVSEASADSTLRGGGAFDRMDLSLGQEYAGGGFGGKDAKLGKLIIEDEGLKMVDLLVAANMALWWRVYDKYETRVKTNRASFS